VKTLATAAKAAIVAGEAIVTGAVEIIPLGTSYLADILASFAGLSWQLPCISNISSDTCSCAAGSAPSVTLPGDPTIEYQVTFLIRGVVELDTYSGGTPLSPSYVVKDATGHGYAAANTYKLVVSNPAATYFLNNGTFNSADVTAVDYSLTIPVQGGATITLSSASNDNLEVRNTGGHVVSGSPDHPIIVSQPFNGQFLQLDALGATGDPIGATGTPLRVWGGYGPITIDGETYQGIGDRGLAQRTAGAIGGVAQGLTLSLSGIDPDLLPLFDDAAEFRGASVVIRRLIFGPDGKTLLDAHVFDRGRIDTIASEETPGGAAAIVVAVESAARGLGRAGARMRADGDQRMINPADGYLKNCAYAPLKELFWGGKKPSIAATAVGG
jgi:hypothetical protein